MRAASFSAAVILVLGGCGGGASARPDAAGGGDTIADASADVLPRPPRICKTPEALGAGPYFKDVRPPSATLTGNRLASADLNEDGFPDVIVHLGGFNNRDVQGASPKIYRRLLLNVEKDGTRWFKDHSKASGFFAIRGGGYGRSSQFAIFGDVNNDGHLDAFSGTYVDANPKAKIKDPGDRSEILLGDGKGGFALAKKSDVSHQQMFSTTSATFLDYDRDGNLDLFVGFFYEVYGLLPANQDRLYRGNGDGTFTEVTDKMGLTTLRASGFAEGKNSRPTYGVTACDIDGDGDQDIMVSAYGRQWNMLWRNDGAKFVSVGKQSGFDGDSKRDYQDNEFYKCYCKTSGKCTADPPRVSSCGNYWNVGSDDQPWRLNGNTFTTVCGDYDNDGDMDLFNAEIRHWHIGLSSDASQMLVNAGTSPLSFDRPGNTKLGLALKPTISSWNEGHISAAFFDFDGDGLKDVIVMDSDYPETYTRLFHQKPDHTFEELAKKAGIAHSRGQEVTVADFDNDGDLDVVMGTSTMRAGSSGPKVASVHLYRNEIGSRSNWIKVGLRGSGHGGANASAIGAWVKITTKDGRTQLQEVGGGYGHFGLQNDLVLHFGLGASCEIEKLEVRWPDAKNTVATFTAVRANYTVSIDQKTGTLTYLR